MSMNNDITIETYNQNTQKYIDAMNFHSILPSVKKWIDQKLSKVPHDALVLEIGAGNGEVADYIESQGFVVERSDASKTFVELMSKRGKKATVFNCINDDFTKKYEMIFAEAVFLHFTKDDLSKALKKIFGTLNSGGKLLFSVKEGSGETWENKKLGARRYFSFWQIEDIKKMVKDAGFKLIEVDKIPDHRGKIKPDWLYVTAIKEEV